MRPPSFFSLVGSLCGVDGLVVPPVEYSALRGHAADVRGLLAEHGVLAVTGVPGYAAARREALQAAIACLARDDAEPSMVLERRLADGAVRRSAAAVTRDGAPLPMKIDGCAAFEAAGDVLRALVHLAVAQVLRAWSRHAVSEEVVLRHEQGNAFAGLEEAAARAEHLEHFHVYAAPRSSEHDDRNPRPASLALHTDAGLLLAFTPPLYADSEARPSALWIQEASGDMTMLELPLDSLAVMVGEAARWLPWPARPVPHALDLPPGATRSWYGMMLRLPDDAVEPRSFDPSSRKQRTFGEWWSNATAVLATGQASGGAPLGCGLTESADLTHSCPEGRAWCWMQCMPLPPACSVSTAQCLHRDGTPWVNRTEMCPTCTLRCPEFGGWDFCDRSAAGSMIMQGFVSYGIRGSSSTPCVVLLFQDWVLGTALELWLGVLGVFALGITVEGVATLRLPARGAAGTILSPCLYMLRMALAYVLMLGAMTFCIEIFVAVVLGLGAGNALFRNARKAAGRDLAGPTLCCSHGDGQGRQILRSDARIAPRQAADGASADDVIELWVDGMTCGSCTRTVANALEGVPGVVSTRVALNADEQGGASAGVASGHAEVSVCRANFPGFRALVNAVDGVGFDARLAKK
mmetsp:Transcript_111884/g.316114  ORF Transcript_111884/g.316114 Transcript_111884/m.316114 type:complete len:635 (+) Transcript_111884:51-1955(+)|eukprot:CAMPEP_0117502066 /NCGR_PEP_ID=MMETSP0784-20121206/23622_1 /TAXON_ID=39447 /ORGANISM="" /LENGTH=634 /DNA_ID=CAMNT_0005297339 /DNA_START=51 /DNA_END=1955 /DNA_ORIENTATION=+